MNPPPSLGAIALILFLASPVAEAQQLPRRERTLHYCNPGPWGDLEYFYTYLEAPDHIIEHLNTPSERTVWSFPGKNLDEVVAFFRESGMPEGAIAETVERSVPFQTGPQYRFFPSGEVIENLSPDCRTAIYSELARFEVNRLHRYPAIIGDADVSEWFTGSGLSRETIALIQKLIYPLSDAFAFSDLPVALTRIETDREERALLKALTRTRSLLVRLRISPDSDFESLKDYWTSGHKHKDILPILESYSRGKGPRRIDLAHLLPPTPRKYLYTYPPIELGVEGIFPDSFWASLNFFQYIPLNNMNSRETIESLLRTNFTRVGMPFRYGDILLVGEGGVATQACVYIADDIVYTKNGRSLLQPFTLMKLGEILSKYGRNGERFIAGWRRNDAD